MSDWKEWSKHVILELKRVGEEVRGLHGTQDEMNDHISQYNLELQRHIAGVEALVTKTDLMKEDQLKFKTETKTRLEVVERPIKWAKSTGRIFRFVGAVGAVTVTLYGLIKLIATG